MSKNSGKWAFGAVVFGVTGYIVGVLTAPKSGKETRKDIGVAANKAKTDAEKMLKVVLKDLNTQIEKAKEVGNNLRGKAKDDLDKAVAKAIIAKDKVREILSTLHDGDADDPELKKAINDAKSALKNLETYIKK